MTRLVRAVRDLWRTTRQRCPLCGSRVGTALAEHLTGAHTPAEIRQHRERLRL